MQVFTVDVKCAFFSSDMENFIRDGKKVLISLEEGREYIWLFADRDMVLVEPGSNNMVTLKGSQIYMMRPGKIDNNIYQVQVFASFDKMKAEAVFNDLVTAGFQDVFLLTEGDWFKVRVGRLSTRSAAERLVPELESKGYSTWILREEKPVEMISIYGVEGDNIFSARSIELIEGVEYKGKNYPGVLGYVLYNNKINVYNKVGLNQLITAVVFAEVKDLYHDLYLCNKSSLEALLKSQAVISRTNLLSKIINKKGDFLYLSAYQGNENDRNDKLMLKISKSVQATDGIVLEEDNKLLEVSFNNTRELLEEAGSGKDYQTILSDLNNYQIVDLTPAVVERVRVNAKVKLGLNYKEIYQLTWWGPRVISILDLDLTKAGYIIEPVLAGGVVKGTTDLVEIVKSREALAGVNGGYFSYSGRPLGLIIKDGVTISEPVKDRTAVIFTKDDVLLARPDWQAVLQKETGEDISCLVNGVNRQVREDELIVYNKYYGERAPELGSGMIELLVIDDIIKAVNTCQEGSETEIPDNGMVFQAHGSAITKLEAFHSGDIVKYREDFSPELQDIEILSALGGGPRLLKEGKVFITAQEEEFQADIAYGRAPRTALGISNDNHLLIFTVDGRQPSLSIGITLKELAEFMQCYGVEEGMNFDGGNSARMVIRGFTMNNPSAKRLISNAIIFKYSR